MNTKLPGYTLKETLFSNARTVIQRALREADGCSVIIKRFEHSCPSPYQRQHFLLSYQLLKRFDHPNITKALDYLEIDGLPVMILEDCNAIDLHQFAHRRGGKPFPINDFLSIAIQLADALSVIHHEQVIHKDLHPGNILISPESGVVKISDFGLASLLSREQPTLTPPEQLEGVLPYISPEQTGRMNRSLDYRSDFYTLGVTFYELLSGQRPFSGEDALGIVHAHIAKAHKPLTQCREDIPPVLSKLIDKLLNKMAEQRYQSALGLKKDLEKCRDMLTTDHPKIEFPLGKDDISDRFQVPQILYGRDAEIKTMTQCFNQAAEGDAQLLTVSGYSGVGKSALIHDVHQSIAAHKGLFISGKFDQFQRNTPYSALKQALKTWLFYALSQSENDLQTLRLALNTKLGANARVLINFMTEFTPLLGELPEVPTLGAQETLNRFNIIFQRFIKLISQTRPLVLFIDDLQWADRGTLNLLPMLLDEDGCRILLIVAYRDNEVDENHPAIQTLTAIGLREGEKITSLVLQPLSLEHTQQLLVDSLHRPCKELRSLAELVQLKTGGNPFFINEFLKTLYNENLLNFDLPKHRWKWDVQAIKNKGITDNVVELMLGKMQQLPEETQKIMQLAACVGSCFDFEMLAIISQSTVEEVTQQLWPAIKEGLILQERGDWLLGAQVTVKGGYTSSIAVSSHCKFLHDRMLEAAYHSLENVKRQVTHLTIGRLLREVMLDEQGQSERQLNRAMLFSVLEQLNHANSLITTSSERSQLASFNLQATNMAKLAGVWDAAANYAAEGMALLPDDAWQNQYELCYELYLQRIECEYLNAHIARANQLSEIALIYARSDYERARICSLQLNYNLSDRLLWAMERGLTGLRYCGLSIPEISQINADWANKEEALLAEQLQSCDLENIVSTMEESDSPELKLECLILTRLSGYSQVAGLYQLLRYTSYRNMRLLLKGGTGQYSIAILGLYSVLLAKQKRYVEADFFSKAAIALTERYPESAQLPIFYNGIGAMQYFYTSPFSEAVEFQQKSHELGFVYGEIFGGIFAGFSNSIINYFVMGLPLERLSKRLDTLRGIMTKYAIKISGGRYYARLLSQLMQPVTSNKNLPNPFDEGMFSSAEWQLIQSCVMKSFIGHLQLQWFFWSEQTDLAWQSVKVAEPSVELMSGFITPLEHRFLAALLACQKYREASTKEQKELRAYIECSLNELETLTTLCPENFEHKLQLLRAEQSRALNDDMAQILARYEQAIQSTRAGGYIQYQALANELCAHYWLAQGFDTAARTKLQQALYLYRLWGCELKCSLLLQKYSRLLGGGAESSESSTISEISSEYSLQSGSVIQANLNFESVMQVAQQISSELKLNKLFSRALHLIAEIAGAQSAAVVMNSSEGLVVEAQFTARGAANEQPEVVLLDECKELPVFVIKHVLHGETVFNYFSGTEAEGIDQQAFNADPYIKSRKPKYMLCVPVYYRDEVIGALYLDGHQLFTDDHLNILNMLLSQTVISFENARLFGKSKRLNKALEQKVEARTLALETANQDLQSANEELKSFSYSVSHDLRSPLRGIKGFSQVLLDDFSEGLDDMGINLLQRIMAGASKMSELINGLLELSRVQRKEVDIKPVNLSDMAQNIVQELNETYPDRPVSFTCAEHITVPGDEIMLYSAMENLLNNAWKYSSKVAQPTIEFGVETREGQTAYFIKDNGAGFDMAHAHHLFGTFQRLHTDNEFPGTGIGLATVKRIINKHAGDIWAEAGVGKGATFYFSLWSDVA